MNRKLLYTISAIICSIATLLYSCNDKPKQNPYIKKAEHTFTLNGSVREINIEPEVVEFQEHEGKAEFMSYCSMCHSLKYIATQPDFPKDIWEAEVHKMVDKYKAPIDSVTGAKIVDYLVSIKSQP